MLSRYPAPCGTERRAIAVDPADPLPVLAAAMDEGLQIVTVLTTHWHFDHSSGNRTLARKLKGLRVIASASGSSPFT